MANGGPIAGLARGLRALCLAVVVLMLAAGPAQAQRPRPDPRPIEGPSPLVDQGEVVDPDATIDDGGGSGSGDPGGDSTGDEIEQPVGQGGEEAARNDAIRSDPGFGSAAAQPAIVKRREAQDDCVREAPPTSDMLGLGGSVSADDDSSWPWLVLLVAGGALAIAAGAFVMRRRRMNRTRSTEPRGTLEVVATLVGILATVAGLAGQFVPGVGADEELSPEAELSVREVHARITREEYARRTGSGVRGLEATDRREVGNVIWLELKLRGYGDRRPTIQYGLYDRDARTTGVLLRDTSKDVALRIEDADEQTSFVPIWVGYPETARFEVQFRLLEGGRVRQMTSTGPMRGSKYRYACARTR